MAGNAVQEAQAAATVDLYQMVHVIPHGIRHGVFTGKPTRGGFGRIFGGQLVGQAVLAASATVTDHPDRRAHSIHAYFLRAGNTTAPVEYEVGVVRDGRSFSVRSIQAVQDGRVLLSATMSFHVATNGIKHQHDLVGKYPIPEELPEEDPTQRGSAEGLPLHRTAVEFRRIPSDQDPGAPYRRAGQTVWLRARRDAGEPSTVTDATTRAAMAAMTDFTILEPLIFAHGLTFSTPGLTVASLDHAVWWHETGDLQDWLLYVQQSPWAGGGRGMVTGRIYDRHGTMLATVNQEGLIRVPETTQRETGSA